MTSKRKPGLLHYVRNDGVLLKIFVTASFLLFCTFAFGAPIALTGRVVDDAQVLSLDDAQKLESMLANFERATTNQVVVVTVKSLEGETIEDFGYKLGRQWGIGQKDKSNGVLLIVAPHDHKVRIEVGYGLEGVLTDAQSKLIISQIIIPHFKRGEMALGIVQGAESIIKVLGGEVLVQKHKADSDDDMGPWTAWIILGCILLIVIALNLSRGGRGGRRGPGIFFAGFGGGRSSGGGGSSSGGGFSGGGGSFGGGGSSGSW